MTQHSVKGAKEICCRLQKRFLSEAKSPLSRSQADAIAVLLAYVEWLESCILTDDCPCDRCKAVRAALSDEVELP